MTSTRPPRLASTGSKRPLRCVVFFFFFSAGGEATVDATAADAGFGDPFSASLDDANRSARRGRLPINVAPPRLPPRRRGQQQQQQQQQHRGGTGSSARVGRERRRGRAAQRLGGAIPRDDGRRRRRGRARRSRAARTGSQSPRRRPRRRRRLDDDPFGDAGGGFADEFPESTGAEMGADFGESGSRDATEFPSRSPGTASGTRGALATWGSSRRPWWSKPTKARNRRCRSGRSGPQSADAPAERPPIAAQSGEAATAARAPPLRPQRRLRRRLRLMTSVLGDPPAGAAAAVSSGGDATASAPDAAFDDAATRAVGPRREVAPPAEFGDFPEVSHASDPSQRRRPSRSPPAARRRRAAQQAGRRRACGFGASETTPAGIRSFDSPVGVGRRSEGGGSGFGEFNSPAPVDPFVSPHAAAGSTAPAAGGSSPGPLRRPQTLASMTEG